MYKLQLLTIFIYRPVNLKRSFYFICLPCHLGKISYFLKWYSYSRKPSTIGSSVHLVNSRYKKTTARGHSILKSQSVLTDVFRYFTLYIIYRYLLFQVRRSLTAFSRLLLLRDLTGCFDLPTCPVKSGQAYYSVLILIG